MNRVLDQTDADNFYLAEENHKLRAEVTRLRQERDRAKRIAYVLAMDLLQSRDQLWRVDDDARTAVETAVGWGTGP